MMPSSDGMTFQHLPPKDVPLMGLPNEDVLTMYDLIEINRGDKTVHNAIMPILMDRLLGSHMLGPNVLVVADMNPPDGDYVVTSSFSSDPAIRRRMCQIVVNFSATEWLAWAKNPAGAQELFLPPIGECLEPIGANDLRPLHPSVIEFTQSDIDLALDRQSRDSGKVYGCPSTWHACSDTLYTIERLELDTSNPRLSLALLTKMSGHVGHAAAQQLLEYHNRSASALDPRDMLLHFADPDNKSHRRVKKLLKDGHAGRISGALSNMATVWAEGVEAGHFTSEDCAPHLAEIFNMVPTDVGGSLLDAIVDADAAQPGAGGPTVRSTGLVRLLHKEPAFKSFRDRRTENLKDKKKREQAATDGLE
jgi:hypothetical protein